MGPIEASISAQNIFHHIRQPSFGMRLLLSSKMEVRPSILLGKGLRNYKGSVHIMACRNGFRNIVNAASGGKWMDKTAREAITLLEELASQGYMGEETIMAKARGVLELVQKWMPSPKW